MPALIRPATREVRTWSLDSRRWSAFRPREDDIIIATYPKCGTTWMQRIVGMLVFGSPEPRDIRASSPWIDARMRQPIEAVLDTLETQAHRRFIKSHLPLEALPFYAGVRYLHVARDGRDVCASFLNHALAQTPALVANFDRIGAEDERIGRPFPRVTADLRAYFRDWIADDASRWPAPAMDFFAFENSYWAERARPNLLLVHYNDLKADLASEMRRIASFLDIACPDDLLARLVEAAGFEAMRRDGDKLMPNAADHFDGGASRFLHKGTNGRWRDVLTADDLALYDAKVAANFAPDCARWVEGGRLFAGDPSPSAH